MMLHRLLPLALLCLALTAPCEARHPGETMADPALQQRARGLYQELRCVVCQNETIDSSNAPLARDLRGLVRQRLRAGDSDAEILAYLEARYGHFVRMTPPVQPWTWLLWFGPLAVLLLSAGALAVWMRRRTTRRDPDAPLTPEEEARAAALLDAAEGDRTQA